MITAYGILGAAVGLVSAVFAYFTLDLSILGALAIYSAMGVTAVLTMAVLVVLRSQDDAEPTPEQSPATGWTEEAA